MDGSDALLAALHRTAEPEAARVVERLIRHGSDEDLARINAVHLAAQAGLDDEPVIVALLQGGAARPSRTGLECLVPELHLVLKIGLHEGPCLAVSLNDRQDYFGQTVNVAARVQQLASGGGIFATDAVLRHAESARHLAENGVIRFPIDRFAMRKSASLRRRAGW